MSTVVKSGYCGRCGQLIRSAPSGQTAEEVALLCKALRTMYTSAYKQYMNADGTDNVLAHVRRAADLLESLQAEVERLRKLVPRRLPEYDDNSEPLV
jgi:hypothetical protein